MIAVGWYTPEPDEHTQANGDVGRVPEPAADLCHAREIHARGWGEAHDIDAIYFDGKPIHIFNHPRKTSFVDGRRVEYWPSLWTRFKAWAAKQGRRIENFRGGPEGDDE